MQVELDDSTRAGGAALRPVHLLGINATGLEAGNVVITAGRTLPWLQDTSRQDVWSAWQVVWRDVVVLDAENRKIGVYNLTVHDLGAPANYVALRSLLLAAARAP